MATKDVCMLANIPQLKGKLQPELAKAKDEALADMEKNMSGNAEKFAPAIKALVSQVFNVADSTLRDAQSATVSLNLGDNGINSTVMAEFEPSSYIGSMAKNLKNSDKSMLTGLPTTKYLFYGGSVNDPATVGKVFDDFIAPVTAELTKIGGPESEAINKYVTSLRAYITATQGGSFGWVAPTGALGQEAIFQMVGVLQGDPAAIKSAYQDMFTSQQALMQVFGAPADAVKTTTTPNAKTVEGVSFDLTHTDINVGQNAPNAAQADQMMKMMYGPEGMNAYTGAVGKSLVLGFCVSDQTLGSVVTAVKGGDDALSKTPGVAAVNEQLPKSRAMSLYVPLDEIATTAGTYAGAMGMPIQIQLPPDLPPIGVTVATEGSAIRVDAYAPTDLIKALVAQGMQLYMQRMGAGAPGGPGGL